MKKFISIVAALIFGLSLVIVYRGYTFFQDTQVYPEPNRKDFTFDRNAAFSRLSKAIQIKTISYDEQPPDAKAFESFHDLLTEGYPLIDGFAKRYEINDHSLVFEIPGTDSTLDPILFMAHMDVVPVDAATLGEWHYPPFSGAIEEEQIWGRGAIDDKSGVMALMESMEVLLSEERWPVRTIYFAFGHDEEVGGPEGARRAAEFFKDRSIKFDFVLDEGGSITQGIVRGYEQPIAMIGVAEKGFVNIRLSAAEKGGHSSTPPVHTAAGILAEAIVRLEANPFPASLEFTNLTMGALGHYAGRIDQIALANQWLFAPIIKRVMLEGQDSAASIRTTTAVTMLSGSSKSNILPTLATAVVNLRIFPGETWESVLARVKEIVDDPRVQYEVFMENNPSPLSSAESRQFKAIETTIRELDPEVLVAPYLVLGGTDSKHFTELSDHVYRFGMFRMTPATRNTFHGLNERIRTEDYALAIQYFYQLMEKTAFE